jgi:hypothetical protein
MAFALPCSGNSCEAEHGGLNPSLPIHKMRSSRRGEKQAMKTQRIMACIATVVFATGCSAHGVSGTYIARGQDFVEMLEVTQAKDGQLLGSLYSTTLKPNGSITRDSTNITGAVEGNALTLVAKSLIPLIPGLNLPGTIEGGVITITNPNGQEQFKGGSPSDYQAAVQQLQNQGAAMQRQKHLADEDAAVADLNKRLTDYAAIVQAPQKVETFTEFHATHVHAVEQAQRQWAAEQKYPRTSFQAGQLDFAVSHTAFNLNLYDNAWDNMVSQGRVHLQQFDAAIAESPCHQSPTLPHCGNQPAAIQVYEAAKPVVKKRIDDIASTLKNDAATMKGLTDQALDYSSIK